MHKWNKAACKATKLCTNNKGKQNEKEIKCWYEPTGMSMSLRLTLIRLTFDLYSSNPNCYISWGFCQIASDFLLILNFGQSGTAIRIEYDAYEPTMHTLKKGTLGTWFFLQPLSFLTGSFNFLYFFFNFWRTTNSHQNLRRWINADLFANGNRKKEDSHYNENAYALCE